MRLLFYLPVGVKVILNAWFVNHAFGAKTASYCLQNGVVRLRDVLYLATLPAVGPAAGKAAHGVGIGAAHKDTGTHGKRQYALVLKQDLAL